MAYFGWVYVAVKNKLLYYRIYEALVLSTLLYSAELWPLSGTLTKNLMLRTTDGKEVYWVSHGRTR